MESNSSLNVAPEFEHITLLINEELHGQRLDKALATIEKVATRSQAARLIQAGRVRIAGRVLKPSYLAQLGDKIDIAIATMAKAGRELEPYDFPLSIPYEDEDLLVVDKPAGLVVHPACGHLQDTLVNALLHHTDDLSLGFNEQRPGLVHRIDKDTSGLLVIAKNETAQRFLADQFQKKTTHRLYRALAFGKFKNDSGTVRSLLRRHPDDRRRVASQAEGKSAVTHYKIVGFHSTGISLVELRLETGRTHQIRVHLSEMEHPIVGDTVYGADSRIKSVKSVLLRSAIAQMPRFALHATELGFVHPSTGKNMVFRAPWPADLRFLLDHCEFPLYNAEYEIEVEGEKFAR